LTHPTKDGGVGRVLRRKDLDALPSGLARCSGDGESWLRQFAVHAAIQHAYYQRRGVRDISRKAATDFSTAYESWCGTRKSAEVDPELAVIEQMLVEDAAFRSAVPPVIASEARWRYFLSTLVVDPQPDQALALIRGVHLPEADLVE